MLDGVLPDPSALLLLSRSLPVIIQALHRQCFPFHSSFSLLSPAPALKMSDIIWIFYKDKRQAVDSAAFAKWFPNIAHEAVFRCWYDGEGLAWKVLELVSMRVPLQLRAIRATLGSLFGVLKSKFQHLPQSGIGHKIQRMLERQLAQDMHAPHFPGLCRSRHRFLTACFIARLTWSQHLTEALVAFFFQKAYTIIRYEEPQLLLREWAVGIHELRGLIHEDTFMDLMYHLSQRANQMIPAWRNTGLHDPQIEALISLLSNLLAHSGWMDYGRGRRPRQALMDYQPRALTAPPTSRFHGPPLALPLPNMLGPPMDTLPSPALSVPVDEVDELRMRQEMLENEVQDLKDEVATGVPMIGWHN